MSTVSGILRFGYSGKFNISICFAELPVKVGHCVAKGDEYSLHLETMICKKEYFRHFCFVSMYDFIFS